MSVSGLAGAINEALNNPSMRQRAAQLGRQIRAEDGVGRAAGLIGRHAAHG